MKKEKSKKEKRENYTTPIAEEVVKEGEKQIEKKEKRECYPTPITEEVVKGGESKLMEGKERKLTNTDSRRSGLRRRKANRWKEKCRVILS